MIDFFRFPHTPHLAWLGTGAPREDKVLSAEEVRVFLSREVIVEEKLDGANLGISADPSGRLQLQNRGQYLLPPFGGQFSRAAGWLAQHEDALALALGQNLLLFGEWCAARHSVAYDRLPDWFIAFDVYDLTLQRFWSARRRNKWAAKLNIFVVPTLASQRMTLGEIERMVASHTSRFGTTPMEGVIIRRDGTDFLEARAKLVRPNFTQTIGEHWRSRRIEWNALMSA
jgi:ATP-dependent RNA circularization protein (DNA/RNA ligase family)